MSAPRIEEVSDDDVSDPEEMDPSAFDFARPQGNLGQPPASSSSSSAAAASQIDPATLQQLLQSQNAPPRPQQPQSGVQNDRYAAQQRERSKSWQCLYPIYFDASRSRQDGRRVRKEEGVENPLARDMVDALQWLQQERGFECEVVFEPASTHPRDWGNPGRVRCLVQKGGGEVGKHQLLHEISTYLRAHPTNDDSPLRLQLQGLPPPKDGKAPKPAVPRGFKMGSILPLHSPALSGGGISQNFLKDMMAEFGGQLPPGMEGLQGMANMGAGGGMGAKGGKPKMVRVRK
ncbi:signal recognition particle subunit [Saxophila tyrrhenica]|uniref:Signal recognition particle subunit n=1 Tax=Saxophila tyrrhenica TaxID=1690608 RepID=A0AAV9P483_9PEZI|nr:signal recognition particle subunit [Saxophila tyrrhenica]